MPPAALTLTWSSTAGAKQRHVLARGPAGGKAGAGLYEVRARVGDYAAEHPLFVLREQAALNYDFEYFALAGAAHGRDVLRNGAPVAVLHHCEVYDHVYLVSAFLNSVGGLESLCCGGHVAVREPDHGTYRHAACEVFLSARDVAGRDADRSAAVFDRLVAELAYFGAARRRSAAGYGHSGKVSRKAPFLSFSFRRRENIILPRARIYKPGAEYAVMTRAERRGASAAAARYPTIRRQRHGRG